jgi:hypothetical protein
MRKLAMGNAVPGRAPAIGHILSGQLFENRIIN